MGDEPLTAKSMSPLLMDLPGAQEHVKLTEQWLRGEIKIPEIADRWTTGPVIRLELQGPESVQPGAAVDIRLILANNKTGHGFPTGPMDVIRSWVELTVVDDQGKLVYEQGKIDDDGKMNPDAFIFKAEGIDREGKLIDRHNLWEMVGAQFKRVLFPGMEDTAMFQESVDDAHDGDILAEPFDSGFQATNAMDVEPDLNSRLGGFVQSFNDSGIH